MTGVYDEADLYCAAFDFSVDAEVEWLLTQIPGLGEGAGVKRVLEPMCGNARYGHAFIRHGLEYVGLDASPSMLARAEVRSGMTLHQADSRAFRLEGEPFDLAFCPIDSIRHLSGDGDIERHLACVRDHLTPAPGSAYVIEVDLMSRDGDEPLPPDQKSQWSIPQPDGSVLEAIGHGERFDLANRKMWERSIYRLVREGEVIREVNQLHEMRQITWADVEAFALSAGFEIGPVHRHESSQSRPCVEPGRHLENTGFNHFIFLMCR